LEFVNEKSIEVIQEPREEEQNYPNRFAPRIKNKGECKEDKILNADVLECKIEDNGKR
jgi:hypothetical protein